MTNQQKMNIAIAQNSYPQFIYKYRADNDFTARIVANNELWFSNPLDFNDPYDCNTPINTNSTLVEIKEWLASVGVLENLIDELADILKGNPNYVKNATEKAMSELGICCFSSKPNNILQWSHYSDYHKGICLRFDIAEDAEFFLTPVVVAYRSVMQHYNHLVQSNKLVDYLIRPKFSEWSYESEVRIVKTAQQIRDNAGNRLFMYKNSALKEIVFGAKTTDVVVKKYKALCANNGKQHVLFSKMNLGSGVHYELVKLDI